jgi:hypothetical protein
MYRINKMFFVRALIIPGLDYPEVLGFYVS